MIRVFIADDHTIFREGSKQILSDEVDVDIVGEATDGDELLAQLPSAQCEIVLLDLSMPGRSGIRCSERSPPQRTRASSCSACMRRINISSRR